MTELQREALAYSNAHEILRDLRSYHGLLSDADISIVKEIALSGDVLGAKRYLQRLLTRGKP